MRTKQPPRVMFPPTLGVYPTNEKVLRQQNATLPVRALQGGKLGVDGGSELFAAVRTVKAQARASVQHELLILGAV